jgi:hypothetical protein
VLELQSHATLSSSLFRFWHQDYFFLFLIFFFFEAVLLCCLCWPWTVYPILASDTIILPQPPKWWY